MIQNIYPKILILDINFLTLIFFLKNIDNTKIKEFNIILTKFFKNQHIILLNFILHFNTFMIR